MQGINHIDTFIWLAWSNHYASFATTTRQAAGKRVVGQIFRDGPHLLYGCPVTSYTTHAAFP